MSLYLLDTNIASHLMRGDIEGLRDHIAALSQDHRIGFSVISEAELFYGWARRGKPEKLGQLIGALLAQVEVLPWTSSASRAYGDLRVACERKGITLATPDMLIASHAKAADAILMTRDKAFGALKGEVRVEIW